MRKASEKLLILHLDLVFDENWARHSRASSAIQQSFLPSPSFSFYYSAVLRTAHHFLHLFFCQSRALGWEIDDLVA